MGRVRLLAVLDELGAPWADRHDLPDGEAYVEVIRAGEPSGSTVVGDRRGRKAERPRPRVVADPVVLDTLVFVDLIRGDQRPRRLLAELDEGVDLWSVSVVRTEIIAGTRPEDGPVTSRVLDELRWMARTEGRGLRDPASPLRGDGCYGESRSIDEGR